MCRTGGRRCPGCQGATARAAHNARRRRNRALRRDILAEARRCGVDQDMLQQLQVMAIPELKRWAQDAQIPAEPGHHPTSPPRQAEPPSSMAHHATAQTPDAAPGAAAPAPGSPSPSVLQPDPGAPTPRRPGHNPIDSASPGDESLGGAAWQSRPWASAQVRHQITTLQNRQGVQRDERYMLSGQATVTSRVGEGVNGALLVDLNTGQRGYFKPIDGEAGDTARFYGHEAGQQAINETAAWQLADRLGEPWNTIVAPCVMREVDGRLGSFSLERPGANAFTGNLRDLPEWKDAAFFDALVAQQDRHHGNFLVAGDRLVLIDQGFTMGPSGAYVNAAAFQQERAQRAPDLNSHEIATLDRLLASPDLLGLADTLTPRGAQALRERATIMRQTQKILTP